ncbi:MAG: DUF3365 domain-containing protein [Magnetococcales bacterium]|nr:DUF3365 domain-containing protein [Magnetococcales bacterium]
MKTGDSALRLDSLSIWTLLVGTAITVVSGVSLHLGIQEETDQAMALAIHTARANLFKDLSLRHWAARHGGVYVPVDERTPPNPGLAHIPERDIQTPSGKRLTLMNPAYILRQVMEENSDFSGTSDKITSLKPLNVANTPDPWEEKALRLFETGTEEVIEVVGEGLDADLRLMRPMIVQEGCLKCHLSQGYKVGDVRGGIGVRVPLRSFRERTTIVLRKLQIMHSLFWGVGMVLLGFYHRVARERKRLYVTLLEREKRLRLTQEHALDAIITTDADGLVEEINPAAETLFGYPKEVLLGRNIADTIIPLELRQAHKDALLRHSGDHGRWTDLRRKLDLSALHADGRIISTEVGLIGLFLDGKRHYTAFVRDVTSRKNLLKSLRETLDVAQSANRMKSEFLANMSHEIRTPMNTIIGMTDLILTVPLSQQEQKSNLEIILQSSQSLLGLINNILDFSKMDAGMIVLERIAFDISGQVESVCNTLAIKAHRQGLELYCELAADVPPTLLGDPLRLNQILINLVNNAIKFTEDGEVVIRVTQASSETTGRGKDLPQEVVELLFSVADTGIGIAEEQISRIFDRFTQVDGSTTRKYGGTGLGLTISKHLVSMMDGDMWVNSVVGQGSVFHFTARFGTAQRSVPRQMAQEEMDARQTEPPHDVLTGMRILVADSHATGRTIVTTFLSVAGGDVTAATDLSSMLHKLDEAKKSNRSFDVLILDHGLLLEFLSLPVALGQQDGNPEKVILLLPSHVSLDVFAAVDWLRGARSVKKPVFKFRLLKAIKQLLGKEPDNRELTIDSSVVIRLGCPKTASTVQIYCPGSGPRQQTPHCPPIQYFGTLTGFSA